MVRPTLLFRSSVKMLEDVPTLVHLAALHQGSWSELREDGFAERLAAVDHEQHRALGAYSTRFEIGQ